MLNDRTLNARITCNGKQFIVRLSNGEVLVAETIAEVAKLLFMAGVPIDGVHCADWREGDLAPLAGQAIALKGEMRRLYNTLRPDKAPLNKK